MKDTNKLSLATKVSFPSLLELAAENDVEAFRKSIELDLSAIDEAAPWYVRNRGAKHITQEERTPLMVAATYGSVDVLKLIVALPEVDLNRLCGQDKWTALHCAAFGGSVNAFDAIKILLSAGADPKIENAYGHHPVDVIVAPPMIRGARVALEDLLINNSSNATFGDCNLQVFISTSNVSSPVLSSPDAKRQCSQSDSESSPTAPKFNEGHTNSASEKKQYPVDPSLPDIRNGIYSTDEFRIFSFKVRPCSRAYSHDWTECPFVHPGENARRRDPRKYHYSCVPCPEFRKGACTRGDMCEYAHGVFECWLHPAQYRTRLCKDGTSCERQVCFFAHTLDELRPLYVSTGSGVPSPRSAGFVDMAAALSLRPGSPTSHSIMSPPPFNQTSSPTANGSSHSSAVWPHPNIPTLHLPGSNLQSSRLRSSSGACNVPPEDLNHLYDFSQSPSNLAILNRAVRPQSMLTPSNLDERFSSETTFTDQTGASGIFSPTHKAALLNQFQQQQPSNLPPVKTKLFSPRNADQPFLHASFGVPSPRLSPRSLEISSPASARLSTFPRHEHNLCSWDFGPNCTSAVGSPISAWSNLGPSNQQVDWSVGLDDQNRLKRSAFFKPNNNGEVPSTSFASTSGVAPSGEYSEI